MLIEIQKRWQCMFDPEKTFIIDNDSNYRKRRIKESIYSIVNKSINRHNIIDDSWNNLLHKETIAIKKSIEIKKTLHFIKKNIIVKARR